MSLERASSVLFERARECSFRRIRLGLISTQIFLQIFLDTFSIFLFRFLFLIGKLIFTEAIY